MHFRTWKSEITITSNSLGLRKKFAANSAVIQTNTKISLLFSSSYRALSKDISKFGAFIVFDFNEYDKTLDSKRFSQFHLSNLCQFKTGSMNRTWIKVYNCLPVLWCAITLMLFKSKTRIVQIKRDHYSITSYFRHH